MPHNHLKKLNFRLKAILPKNIPIANTLADLLNISKEGAYRRLRGETSFSLEEALNLRKAFGISLDELTGSTEQVSFGFRPMYNQPLNFTEYLKDITVRFKKIGHISNSTTYNVCGDLPFFRQFGYPNLASFKIFYWKHSILNDKKLENTTFSLKSFKDADLELAENIYDAYLNVNSAEVWTTDTIVSILKQLEYFYDCGLFEQPEDLPLLYHDLILLLNSLRKDARATNKIDRNGDMKGDFTLYLCELRFDNNSIFFKTDKPRYLANGFNSFNSLQTEDQRILEEYQSWFDVMLSKSITISGQAERYRHDFYKYNLEQILQSAASRLSLDQCEELRQVQQFG